MNDYKITDDHDWLPSTLIWICYCEIKHVIKEVRFLVYEFIDKTS